MVIQTNIFQINLDYHISYLFREEGLEQCSRRQ